MTMDIRMEASELMTAQDEEENFTFPWHCREGILHHIDKVTNVMW